MRECVNALGRRVPAVDASGAELVPGSLSKTDAMQVLTSIIFRYPSRLLIQEKGVRCKTVRTRLCRVDGVRVQARGTSADQGDAIEERRAKSRSLAKTHNQQKQPRGNRSLIGSNSPTSLSNCLRPLHMVPSAFFAPELWLNAWKSLRLPGPGTGTSHTGVKAAWELANFQPQK